MSSSSERFPLFARHGIIDVFPGNGYLMSMVQRGARVGAALILVLSALLVAQNTCPFNKAGKSVFLQPASKTCCPSAVAPAEGQPGGADAGQGMHDDSLKLLPLFSMVPSRGTTAAVLPPQRFQTAAAGDIYREVFLPPLEKPPQTIPVC